MKNRGLGLLWDNFPRLPLNGAVVMNNGANVVD